LISLFQELKSAFVSVNQRPEIITNNVSSIILIVNRKNSSSVFLVLGLAFLAIGISTDQTAFSWAAIAFVVLSLVLGGRWLRPRK